MAVQPEDTLILSLNTGDVTIAMRPDLAPKHVARIKELVRDGFYDGLTFHRVVDQFVAQGGCPEGSGMGGSGKKLPAEFNSARHDRGAVSMARAADPNSADSQFFICLDNANFLDGQYTVWGEVIDGMNAVDALPKGEPPTAPGVISSARIAGDDASNA